MRLSKIFRFTLGSRILAVKVNIWNQELHTHYGITNETPDGYYIPFWDFDEKYPISDIIDSLRAIQADKRLGEIYVIKTWPRESYRAFSFDVMDFQYFIATLSWTDYIDWSYLKHTVMRGRAVLRISEKDGTKNICMEVLHAEGNWRSSEDHQMFFHSLYPDAVLPVDDFEGKIKVRLSKYESFR